MLLRKHKYFCKKRTVILASSIFVAVLFLFAWAAGAQVDVGLDSANPGLGEADLETIIVNIVKVALGFLGLLAVIFIMYGGFTWMLAGGNQDKVAKGRKILINAVIGLVIILSAYAIASFIFSELGWIVGSENSSSSSDSSYYYSGGLAVGG
jgi:type IV secretory pathway VirB2 component (pilin)